MSRGDIPLNDATQSMQLGRPSRPTAHRSAWSRLTGRLAIVRRYGVPFFSEFVRDTPANATVFLTRHGRPLVGKYFVDDLVGQQALAGERRSWEVFAGRPWRMPVERIGSRSIMGPRLPDGDRLDVRARTMSTVQRLDISAWALEVLVEIYMAGYFHGDLQPHNVWYLDGRPVVTDWSTFAKRTADVPFARSADITGHDPGYTRRFDPAFDPDDPWSFHNTLDVTLAQAAAALIERLAGIPDPPAGARAKLQALEGVAA